MKNYIKPSIKYIELRIEEGLAGIGSISAIIKERKSIANMLSFEDNFPAYFYWLKMLRK